MPSSSRAQAKLMAAVAHGWSKPGGGGPTKAVAEEFHKADKRVGKFEHARGSAGKLEKLTSRNRRK